MSTRTVEQIERDLYWSRHIATSQQTRPATRERHAARVAELQAELADKRALDDHGARLHSTGEVS